MRVLLLLTVVAAAASQFYGSRGVGRVSFAPVVTRPVQLVVQQRPSVIIGNSVFIAPSLPQLRLFLLPFFPPLTSSVTGFPSLPTHFLRTVVRFPSSRSLTFLDRSLPSPPPTHFLRPFLPPLPFPPTVRFPPSPITSYSTVRFLPFPHSLPSTVSLPFPPPTHFLTVRFLLPHSFLRPVRSPPLTPSRSFSLPSLPRPFVPSSLPHSFLNRRFPSPLPPLTSSDLRFLPSPYFLRPFRSLFSPPPHSLPPTVHFPPLPPSLSSDRSLPSPSHFHSSTSLPLPPHSLLRPFASLPPTHFLRRRFLPPHSLLRCVRFPFPSHSSPTVRFPPLHSLPSTVSLLPSITSLAVRFPSPPTHFLSTVASLPPPTHSFRTRSLPSPPPTHFPPTVRFPPSPITSSTVRIPPLHSSFDFRFPPSTHSSDRFASLPFPHSFLSDRSFPPPPTHFFDVRFPPLPHSLSDPFAPLPHTSSTVRFPPLPHSLPLDRSLPFPSPSLIPRRSLPSPPPLTLDRSLPSPSPLTSFDRSLDYRQGGSEYHFSWRHDNGRKYPWEHAVRYCSSLGHGWSGISIETHEEDRSVSNIITGDGLEYIWTGGYRSGYDFAWPSRAPFVGLNWSHTGATGHPQPDNREQGGENCLAVLNNFYDDGVRWHDVGCHHEKPIICERQGRVYG
ncbi:mannose-binding protein [Penaeus vannamei]|uniref:Mannose-binding protein n=1 Tax=Penaeus vannamei TaxID=6689 RepID=A0A423SM49_PENVA|nr:mannose-binding protein [Penaeus vannamei]